MKTVCAWCSPKPEAGVIVSHGICTTCQAKLMAELESTPEPTPYESRPGSYYGHYGI